jgi:hypothetical protein
MLQSKLFEVRDEGTFIPVLAIKIEQPSGSNAAERYLVGRAGWHAGHGVIVMNLNSSEASHNPYDWKRSARTMPVAHAYIEQHFDKLEPGQVIDAQFILKETTDPKISERHIDGALYE